MGGSHRQKMKHKLELRIVAGGSERLHGLHEFKICRVQYSHPPKNHRPTYGRWRQQTDTKLIRAPPCFCRLLLGGAASSTWWKKLQERCAAFSVAFYPLAQQGTRGNQVVSGWPGKRWLFPPQLLLRDTIGRPPSRAKSERGDGEIPPRQDTKVRV